MDIRCLCSQRMFYIFFNPGFGFIMGSDNYLFHVLTLLFQIFDCKFSKWIFIHNNNGIIESQFKIAS